MASVPARILVERLFGTAFGAFKGKTTAVLLDATAESAVTYSRSSGNTGGFLAVFERARLLLVAHEGFEHGENTLRSGRGRLADQDHGGARDYQRSTRAVT